MHESCDEMTWRSSSYRVLIVFVAWSSLRRRPPPRHATPRATTTRPTDPSTSLQSLLLYLYIFIRLTQELSLGEPRQTISPAAKNAMDDPWAAGPSWAGTSRSTANADTNAHADAESTSPKASKAVMGMVMPRSPKQGFSADEADPWGLPPRSGAGGGSGSSASEGMRMDIHRPDELGAGAVGAADLAQAKGWELEQEEASGWGEPSPSNKEGREDVQREAEIARSPESPITTSPKARRKSSADHAGVWSLNSPKVETASFPSHLPPESPLRSHDEPHEPGSHTSQAAPPEIPLPTSPELASPPKTMPNLPTFSSPKSGTSPRLGFGHFPHDSFGSHTSFADPGRDELGFGDSSMSISRAGTMPHSPSFGEDGFGGFSTALEGDPWGGGGWGAEPGPEAEPESERGEGSRRRDSGFASIPTYAEGGDERNVEVEDEEEEGEGWGGVKSQMEVPPPTSGMDKDWEEAQWRIKVQEERAVRPPRHSYSSILDRHSGKSLARKVAGQDLRYLRCSHV